MEMVRADEEWFKMSREISKGLELLGRVLEMLRNGFRCLEILRNVSGDVKVV